MLIHILQMILGINPNSAWMKNLKTFKKQVSDRGISELRETYKMKFFEKIVNSWKPLTIVAKHSILDVWLGCEYT